MLSAVLGCGLPSAMPHTSVSTPERVAVAGAAIVGFFPKITDAEVTTDVATSAAVAHFEWALHDAARCFEARGVTVRTVYGDTVLVERDGEQWSLPPSDDAPDGIGVFLIAPHREPRLVVAPFPSALGSRLMQEAATYFDLPTCPRDRGTSTSPASSGGALKDVDAGRS